MAAKAVREVAVESVLAVAGEIMDAWIEASIDMGFGALLWAGTLLEGKVLVTAVGTDGL